jgi:Uma2 family endonuclease
VGTADPQKRYAIDMHLVLPDQNAPTRVILGDSQPIGDDEFYDFCMANPDLRIERSAQGEIIIVPPAGGESDHHSLELGAQLRNWAKKDKRGKAFGSTACFLLPDGAGLSPDAAWVIASKVESLSRTIRRKFMPIVPEFVIEVMSPSDRLKPARAKMEQWIANGTLLAWLIDGDHRTVYIYRPGKPCQIEKDINQLEAGNGPISGFVADLTDVWAGL